MLTSKERANLAKLTQKYSFQNLRPSPEVYEIVIPEDQYFYKTGSNEKRRKIFYKVPYETRQIQAIDAVKLKLSQKYIKKDEFSDQFILKHIYSAKFDSDKALERLIQIMQFHRNENITKFTPQTIKRLEEGYIYTYGHDKGMRPILVMRVDKFDITTNFEHNFNIVYYFMLVIIGYKLVPYHAEKYVCLMDFNNMNFSDIPFKFFYEIFSKVNLYYSGNVQKIFLFNAKGLNWIWSMTRRFLPQYQQKKIMFVESGKQKEILQYIEAYELQKKYGGKLQNLKTFWPPKNTNESFDVNLLNQSESDFYSVENDIEYFSEKHNNSCGCSCNIM